MKKAYHIKVYLSDQEVENLQKIADAMERQSPSPDGKGTSWRQMAAVALHQGETMMASLWLDDKIEAQDDFDRTAEISQPSQPSQADSAVDKDEDDGGSPMPPPDFAAMSAREVYRFFYRAWRTYRHANPGGEFGFLISGDERLKALKVAALKCVLMKEYYTTGETVSGYIFPESNLPLWQHALVNRFIWEHHSKPSIEWTETWKQLEAVAQ